MKLDIEQEKPVQANKSVSVIAGPGSGKTRVLIAKAQLLASLSKSHIALTFTRNASKELRSRSPQTQASTIHAFCYRYIQHVQGGYEQLLWDFLSINHKPKFDWVLIDESQDLTELEWEVCKTIVKPKGHFFLVGDPCQHIYAWHEEPFRLGSTGFNPIKICKEEAQLTTFFLNNNYRSTTTIINQIEKIHRRGLVAKGVKGAIHGTAVLFRTNNQLNLVAYALDELGIKFSTKRRGLENPGDIRSKGINNNILLATIHCTKGLEFKKVICWDWGERILERNLHYVAASRAAQDFYLISGISELLRYLNGSKS